MSHILKKALTILSATFGLGASASAQDFNVASSEKLLVVVRSNVGYNTYEDSFEPFKIQVKTDDKKIDSVLEMAWYKTIGNLHIRFVFDGEQSMRNATLAELKKLNLPVDKVLQLALKNIHSTYGYPEITPWQEGIFLVHGKSPDLDSSYFLDREFWKGLLKKHPEGIVVAVPNRSGLLFTPISENYAIELLKLNIANIYESSPEQLRISSGLYLFKNNTWSVFQPANL